MSSANVVAEVMAVVEALRPPGFTDGKYSRLVLTTYANVFVKKVRINDVNYEGGHSK